MNKHTTALTDFGSILNFDEAVQLNNKGHALVKTQPDQALSYLNRSVGIKERLHGLNSVHCCITISGIADAYLYKYRNTKDINDLNLSQQYVEQLYSTSISINSREQQRIAREILMNIAQE